MQVTPAFLSSIATFYDMLRTRPIGSRDVYVCTSVACHLRNAKSVYDAIAARGTEQGLEDVDLREFECLGACDMAPMASVDGRYVGPLDESDAAEIVAALKEGREVLPAAACPTPATRCRRSNRARPRRSPSAPRRRDVEGGRATRRAAADRERAVSETRVLLANIDEPDLNTIAVYERLGGYRPLRKALLEMTPRRCSSELEESGLRGRGGAGFSMGKKASASSPRARWTSTSAATPTSPSPAPSRTAC